MNQPASRPYLLAAALAIAAAIVVALLAGRRFLPATGPAGGRPVSLPGPDWPGPAGGGPMLGTAVNVRQPPLRVRWQYRGGTPKVETTFDGGAAIDENTVYAADMDGFLHAIDLATGQRRWRFEAQDGLVGTPAIVTVGNIKLIVTADHNGRVYGVDAATGKQRWLVEFGDPIFGGPNAADGKVLIGAGKEMDSRPGRAICLNALDGKQLWEFEIGTRINAPMAIQNKIVYLGACDRQLHALELSSGEPLWSVELGAPTGAAPAVAGDRVLIGIYEAAVLCFDLKGKPLWQFDKIENRASVSASPAIADGTAVVGAKDETVYALNLATGEPRWTFPAGGEIEASAMICDGRVFVGTRAGKLFALDLATGKELWHFEVGNAITGPLAAAHGVLIVTDHGGNVWCLE